MFVWILLLLATIFSLKILVVDNKTLRRKPSKLYFLLVLLILCVICSIRDNSLRDTSLYIESFTDDETRFEIGYKYLIALLRNISANPHFMFGTIAMITVGMKLFFFRSYSSYFLPILLLYLTSSYIIDDLIAIRAAIASGLFLWEVKLAIDKRFLFFILVVFLSSLFHITSLICLLIWPITNFKIKLKIFLWLIPISYLFFLSGRGVGYLASYIPIPYVQSLFALYSQDEGIANVFSPTQIVRSVVCVFIIWKCRNKTMDIMHESMLKLYCFSISLFVLVTDVGALSARLSALFALSIPYVLANMRFYLPALRTNSYRLLMIFFASMFLTSNILNVLN